jgi:leucyl-tRNA synthetase
MFPYPSGSGLHLGHYYNYAIIDSYCKWQRYKGKTVFQPFGYDAFGLPAENYARSVGGDAKEVTYQNIENFRSQMNQMQTDYVERLITSDAQYIKWTQWIFTKLHEHGLAYKAWSIVNWCPSCETVLANEQVSNDLCERCSSQIIHKNLNQWFFKITDYKDRLISNLDKIDYPVGTIKQQRAWLENLKDWCVSRQRKWGCPIPIEGEEDTLDTFVDSSFYFLRYLTDSENQFLPKENYQQVDLYVGGSEHACMHLIYSRFIHMFLYDIGIVPIEEPFKKVIHQGMITSDGAKMSKSKGNTINPDNYNSTELRFHLMFIGHYFDGGDWSDNHIKGVNRFFKRMNIWLSEEGQDYIDLKDFEHHLDNMVESFKFNKIVSGFMEFYNNNKHHSLNKDTCDQLKKLLNIFAPEWNNS